MLAALVADGALVPRIGAEVSWRDLGQVVAALRGRTIAGKAVLHVD